MSRGRRRGGFVAACLAAATLAASCVVSGCGKRYPRQVEARGTIELDGKPLPSVQVDLIPLFGGFGAEVMASSAADEDGRFTLASGLGPKVCEGRYKVTVTELPVPPELMKYESGAAARIEAHYKALPNRPVPERYGTSSQTPLEVNIESGQTEYRLKLERER